MARFSRKRVGVVTFLLLVAFGFRLFVALRLPNDTPDDGRVYAQIARNILEQHVYSHEEQPPFVPSLIRLPGYPLLLSAVYAVAGNGNNTAVRLVQALIDTGTCALIALVAFQWTEDEKQRRNAATVALLLAAICPFTAIYVATILTEVPTSFLAVLLCLLSTLAFKTVDRRRSVVLWLLAGLTAGFAVFFRPDSGLFAAAIGFTILLSSLRAVPTQIFIHRFLKAVLCAAIFSFAFCLVLVPWTIRNRRVFGVFQPLSPTHGEMPGEFVPRGYLMWLRTWLDDGRYVGPVLWRLDTAPISIDAFPKKAFDSTEERERVAVLMEKYNGKEEEGAGAGAEAGAANAAAPETSPNKSGEGQKSGEAQADQKKSPEAESEDKGDDQGEDNAEDEGDEESSDEESQDSADSASSDVEMTPEIDAAFAQIARERISRAPLRYYVILPLKRGATLWFDTHSQYYPFDGELLPLKDLDYAIHQHYWLPLFAGLTWVYTILGVLGGWLLYRSRSVAARRWVMLAALIVFLRLGFFSTLENPEPRYTVEIFPFLAILGGIAVSLLTPIRKPSEHDSLDLTLD